MSPGALLDNLINNFHLHALTRNTNAYLCALLFLAFVIFVQFYPVVFSEAAVDAPTVGRRSRYEPLFWVRLRFFQQAWPIISEGYQKVSCSIAMTSFPPVPS